MAFHMGVVHLSVTLFLCSDKEYTVGSHVFLYFFPALAEIISKRQDSDGSWEFYVHYINC